MAEYIAEHQAQAGAQFLVVSHKPQVSGPAAAITADGQWRASQGGKYNLYNLSPSEPPLACPPTCQPGFKALLALM